jgi:phosphopantothenoylcysteine decarboxylase/phosphopantothenate--cysteine ligase
MHVQLEKTQDILKELGCRKKDQILVGFAAETEDLHQNAGKKLAEKNLDIIAGNLIGGPTSGFAADTNKVTLFFRDGTSEEVAEMEKDSVAHLLLDRIVERVPANKAEYTN